MRSSKKSVVTLCLLAASIFTNIILYAFITTKSISSEIIGTYCTGIGISENDTYIVFSQDDYYTLYKQFEILEGGEYKPIDTSVYTLIPQGGNHERHIVYDGTSTVFVFDAEQHITSFSRISSNPLFINLSMSENGI